MMKKPSLSVAAAPLGLSVLWALSTCHLSTDAFAPKSRWSTFAPTTLFSQIGLQQQSTTAATVAKNDSWMTQPFLNPLSQFVKGPKECLVFDTTLRDGTQGESVSASCDDKLKIATRLSSFDVDYIEAGWPGSNPKDAEFFQRAQTELSAEARSKLVAFGSSRRKNVAVEDDPQIQALVDSNVPTICMVVKAHPWQVTEILRATREENLQMIHSSVEYLVKLGKTVLVDLEHFFDGYKVDPEYALACCEAAVDAGASCLVMCDTNGGTMPWEVDQTTRKMLQHFEPFCTIGVHCHNDCGMAVANSITACHAGVGLIQGTINGIGERTGNADLCSIVPSLALHVNTTMACNDQLSELTQVSRYVDEILNRSPNNAAPFVGQSAFAHKGGLHVAAMERNPLSYQHVEPELVGNEMRVLISELSGRQNIMGKLQEIFGNSMDDGQKSARSLAILNRVKELENMGYQFEGADASVHLMMLHTTRGYCPPFQVLDYSAQVYDANMDSASRVVSNLHGGLNSASTARATIKVRTVVDDPETSQLSFVENLQVSDGNGPVDALAKALLKALLPAHPFLDSVELIDYKVRILDPNSATEAVTRVMIEFRDSETDKQWTTVSVDSNVVSASLNALIDGFEYALIEQAQLCMLCDDAFEDEQRQ
ncbi:2-isopropylmalate synthase [Nitzschia inconspicua]|uniref:(R)-citramalate synthase n=1 Tax=Nitzschia inconspicua TaxID=303405 RepID=A0A9K3KPL8_9STRA|nr:2-isopropylmalate synthase [Nitzschia inconspicua]